MNSKVGIVKNINEIKSIIIELKLINDIGALVFANNDLLYYQWLVNDSKS